MYSSEGGIMKALQRIRGILLLIALTMGIAVFVRMPSQAAQIQKVHTIYWKAKLTCDIKVKIKGKKKKLKEGTNVVVTNRSYLPSGRSKVSYNGAKFKVKNTKLYFIEDLCTVVKEGDYNLETKLHFVNKAHSFPSKTPFLVWICLDKQRINIFRGAAGNWTLVKKMRCSSGLADSPTKARWNGRIGFKARVYSYSNPTFSATVEYFNEFGGSGIHKWGGPGRAQLLGKHTASHSCVRLSKANAIWFYNTVPIGTRVVIY